MGLSKPAQLSHVSHGNTITAIKSKCKTRKSRHKKVYLKSDAQKLYGTKSVTHPQKGTKKKVLYLKKKCIIGKKHKKLMSIPLDSKRKMNQCPQSLDCGIPESKKDDQKLETCALETSAIAVPPVFSEDGKNSNLINTTEDVNSNRITTTLDVNSMDQADLALKTKLIDVSPGKMSGSKLKSEVMTQRLAVDAHSMLDLKNESFISPSRRMTPAKKAQSDEKLSFMIGSCEHLDRVSQGKGASKPPLTTAKCKNSTVMQRKKAFYKFFLRNSQGGCHLALKKFRHQTQKKQSDCDKVTQAHPKVLHKSKGALEDIPLEVLVSRKLSSCSVAQSADQISTQGEPTTPIVEKMVRKMKSFSKGTTAQNVVTCSVPFETAFKTASTEVSSNFIKDTSNSSNSAQNLTSITKRDVCYIFALLDREKDETLFKCSPQMKTVQILQHLSNVIDSISADDDIVSSKKLFSQEVCGAAHYKRAGQIDKSTSPVPLLLNPSETESFDLLKSSDTSCTDREKDNSLAKVPEKVSVVKTDEVREPTMCRTTKVMVSKALLSFTSDLKVLTDVSIRLLGWCSGTVKGDLDSDSLDDDFEGFLCHCHDKVSILIECLSVLDSKQIFNIDEAELTRFWLLHDTVMCLLQVYRYMQCPSASPSLNQQLISLMTTCSKMILPHTGTTISQWASMMTMVSAISQKLCEDQLLMNVCLCHQHFAALRTDRSCRVCNLNNLYKDICKLGELSAPMHQCVKTTVPKVDSVTIVEQLFPRFYWFLSKVEDLSKEEFMATFAKHSVARFSCNKQSGLYPCDEHLLDITCSCFAFCLIRECQDLVQTGENTSPEMVIATQKPESKTSKDGEGCVPSEIMNQQTAQNIMQEEPKCIQICASQECKVEKKNENSDSLDALLDETESAKLNLETASTVLKRTVVESDEFQRGKETLSVTEEYDCEVITLSEGGSSQDFSLQIEESPSETELEDLNAQSQSCEEGVTARGNVGEAGCKVDLEDSVNSQRSSTLINIDACSQDTTAITTSSSCIDYSPLNFGQAQSNIENAYSSLKAPVRMTESERQDWMETSSSVLSFSDSVTSLLKEVSVSAENVMRDVSIEDNSVFALNSLDLVEESSLRGNVDSTSIDEDDVSLSNSDINFESPELSNSPDKRPTLYETDSSSPVTLFLATNSINVPFQDNPMGLDGRVPPTLAEETKSSKFGHKDELNQTRKCHLSICPDILKRKIINRMEKDCKQRLIKGIEKQASGVESTLEGRSSNEISSNADVPIENPIKKRKKGENDDYVAMSLEMQGQQNFDKKIQTVKEVNGLECTVSEKKVFKRKVTKSDGEPLNIGGDKKGGLSPQYPEETNVSCREKYPFCRNTAEPKSLSCLKFGKKSDRLHSQKRVKFALDQNHNPSEVEKKEEKQSMTNAVSDNWMRNSELEVVVDSLKMHQCAIEPKNEHKKRESERKGRILKMKKNKCEDISCVLKEEEKIMQSKETLLESNVGDDSKANGDLNRDFEGLQTMAKKRETKNIVKTSGRNTWILPEQKKGMVSEVASEKNGQSSRAKKTAVRNREEFTVAVSKTQVALPSILSKNHHGGKRVSLSSHKNFEVPAALMSPEIAESLWTKKILQRQIERGAMDEATLRDVFGNRANSEHKRVLAMKSKHSRKANLHQAKDDQLIIQYLNESDPDWKKYLADLKGRILND